ncbi:hypothetical protein U1Q18_042055 [Sarracenia purpurea var. burkii]
MDRVQRQRLRRRRCVWRDLQQGGRDGESVVQIKDFGAKAFGSILIGASATISEGKVLAEEFSNQRNHGGLDQICAAKSGKDHDGFLGSSIDRRNCRGVEDPRRRMNKGFARDSGRNHGDFIGRFSAKKVRLEELHRRFQRWFSPELQVAGSGFVRPVESFSGEVADARKITGDIQRRNWFFWKIKDKEFVSFT